MHLNFADPDINSKDDRAACRALIRTGSHSFYVASMLMPRKLRDDAYALYAFCRISDDLVDEKGGDEVAIARLKVRLDRVYHGDPIDHPVDRAFARVVEKHGLPRALPEALIEGFEWDVRGFRAQTFDDVVAYAARVAGTVGAMMAVLMGARDENLVARACDLGVAMQLTNIARDVGEDAVAGRLYLPRAWMREEGIDPNVWVQAPCFGPAIGRIVQRLLDAAAQLYLKADPAIAALPAECRSAIYAARHIYHAIGDEIASQGYDSVGTRARVPMSRKLTLLARAKKDALTYPLGDVSTPPLPQTSFLVQAVIDEHVPESIVFLDGISGRILWVADLFSRLEARGRTPQSQGLSALQA